MNREKFELQSVALPKQFLGIQYARGLAALGVLIFHAAQKTDVDFAAGARGVDLFFVISGFIMWVTTTSKPVSPEAFMVARIKRIVPLYWIATSFLAISALAGLFPVMREELTWNHFFQSLLFIPHFSPGNGQIWPVLVPGWTLNFEMFFYLVFAICLLFPTLFRLLIITSVFVALVVFGQLSPGTSAPMITYTDPLILEFIAGVWLAVIVQRLPSPSGALAWVIALGGLVVLMAVPFWGGLAERLACLFGAALCIYGVVSLDLRKAIPDFLVARIIGDASYSIYLWHGIAVSVAAAVAYKFGLPTLLIIPASIVGGLILGLMSYFFIEKPIAVFLSKSKSKVSVT